MNLQERDLIEKSLANDETAFEKLLDLYLKPVFNFVYQLVADFNVAEDISQETFVKVWKNLGSFDRKKNFKTWVFTIAKNTALDWLKRKKSLPFSFFGDEEDSDFWENIPEESILPDKLMERQDLAMELERKLSQLTDSYRIILILHYRDDFSLREIAEILGKPYNTVKAYHQRGLLQLKKFFDKE